MVQSGPACPAGHSSPRKTNHFYPTRGFQYDRGWRVPPALDAVVCVSELLGNRVAICI